MNGRPSGRAQRRSQARSLGRSKCDRHTINVLVTSLYAISDPKVAIACESIKGKLLNGNAYKTQVRGKNDKLYKMAISDFVIL